MKNTRKTSRINIIHCRVFESMHEADAYNVEKNILWHMRLPKSTEGIFYEKITLLRNIGRFCS